MLHRFTQSGCKDKAIKYFEFEARTRFLSCTALNIALQTILIGFTEKRKKVKNRTD